MIKLILTLAAFCLLGTACNNKAEVPATVQVQTAPVTGEVIVRHVMQIELPTVFTDSCKQQFQNDDAGYNKCVSDYINSIIKIINGIDPNQLPNGDL